MSIRAVALYFILCSVLLLSACDDRVDLQGSHDVIGERMIVTVYVYDDAIALTEAYEEYKRLHGQSYVETIKQGWAAWRKLGERIDCEIHVLRLYGPEDPEMQTWGHELAHCTYGSYHK